MLIDLFNPFKVSAILRKHRKCYLLIVMVIPFTEPLVYSHFSVIFSAIGLGAFFQIAYLVSLESDD
jgi:hypothetical protein